MVPAFAETPDEPTVQRWLDRSVRFFNADAWDDLLPDGVSNWVAHNLVLEAQLGATFATAGGGLDAVGKGVGQMRVQYSDKIVDLKAKDPFMRTVYGQEYRRLQRMIGAALVTSA